MLDRVLAVVCGVLILALLATGYQLNSVSRKRAEEAARYRQQVIDAQNAYNEEVEKRRKATQELIDAQEKHRQETEALHLALDRARHDNRVAADGMRDAVARAAAKARAKCAAAATPVVGPTTDDPIGVLAHVLGRADARAGLLADIAEQRYIAGRACEREYDAAREKLKAN